MKETEEEKFRKIYQSHENIDEFYSIFSMCKEYHTTMLKSSIPSEEEIVSKGKEWLKETGWHDADLFSYKKGFKDALTLLTKGDR